MKKTINFILVAIVATPLFFSSCSKKKSATPSGYYVTYKINGSIHTDNLSPAGIYETSDTASAMIITAYSGSSVQSATEGFGLIIGSANPLKSGQTYNLPLSDDATDGSELIYSNKSNEYEAAVDAEGSASTVTIKSITSNTIQGTFSGTLPMVEGSGSVTVTDGSFYVPYTKENFVQSAIKNKKITLKLQLNKGLTK